jgi:hypothetical protein
MAGRWSGPVCLALLLLLSACAAPEETATPPAGRILPSGRLSEASRSQQGASALPVDLTLVEGDVDVAPLPLRAGFPFTVTAKIHNNTAHPAVDVPLMIHISANQERIGYVPFLQVITVTVAASQTVPIEIPVDAPRAEFTAVGVKRVDHQIQQGDVVAGLLLRQGWNTG